MKNFFISYNKADKQFAEWITWQLEEESYTAVIQAWDFGAGNWLLRMDQAMKETERTIAVLSPNYLTSLYTQSEWANAFRQDPTGAKDLIVPILVAPVELSGVLAQLPYVDLTGRGEEEAREMLLRRVRGERGKPSVAPRFPGSPQGDAKPQRSISVKPPYPADLDDQKDVDKFTDVAVAWRGMYASKVKELRTAREQLNKYRFYTPVTLEQETIDLVLFTGKVARDLESFPLTDLKFARDHGLDVHDSVLNGYSVESAQNIASRMEPKILQDYRAWEEERRAGGLPAHQLAVSSDDFEMLERVLRAAVSLATFDIGRLSRGYEKKDAQAFPANLSQYRSLFLASIDYEPGLYLVSVDTGLDWLGRLAARKLPLSPVCAQRNQDGALDVVGYDTQHVYFWQGSSSLPTLQLPAIEWIRRACFLSSKPDADVLLVDSTGTVSIVSPSSGLRELVPPSLVGEKGDIKGVTLWVDPQKEGDWYSLSCNGGGDVVSMKQNEDPVVRKGGDLWHDAEASEKLYKYSSWGDCSLSMGVLSSLPCLIVTRKAPSKGSLIHFLHPLKLTDLRPPLRVPYRVLGMTLAAQRWLVLTRVLDTPNESGNKLEIWDLLQAADRPVGGSFADYGEVYRPSVLVEEDGKLFQTVQVFRDYTEGSGFKWTASKFSWPSREIEPLGTFASLQLAPVHTH